MCKLGRSFYHWRAAETKTPERGMTSFEWEYVTAKSLIPILSRELSQGRQPSSRRFDVQTAYWLLFGKILHQLLPTFRAG